MKTFNITYYPICGGIAVAMPTMLRAKTRKAAIAEASKKSCYFRISEAIWVNGERKFIDEELINLHVLYNNK